MCLFFLSCAKTQIKSDNAVPVFINAKAKFNQLIEIEKQYGFYLWGLLPDVHEINLDKEFYDQGAVAVANIQVEQFQDGWDIFKSIISFGMYVPYHLRLRGFALEKDEN